MSSTELPNPKRFGAAAAVLTLVAAVSAQAVYAQTPVQLAADTSVNVAVPLTGVVEDARGLPLLGAFVAVIALGADQPTAIVVTDGRGAFSVASLPSGVYSLLVGSLGFTGTVLQGVNVPSAVPVTLQLQPEEGRRLSSFDAPLDLSFALRTGKRDVLRQGEGTLVTGGNGGGVASTAAMASDSTVRPSMAMAGEVRLWSFTDVGSRQTVGVTSIDLSGQDRWNLRAHVGNHGDVWAASNVEHDLDNHSLRVGFGYVGGGFQFDLPEQSAEQDSWIGRLQVEDTWRATGPLEVRYGIRYEHHNYLARGELLSPTVEVAYDLLDTTRLMTGVSMNSTGLGLADDNGFEVMSVLNEAGLQVNDTTDLSPERALRYHFGVEQAIGDAEISLRAYYDEVTDELLGVYVSGAEGAHNYLLFNVGDTSARGFEFGVAGQIVDMVSGEISYSFREREHGYPVSVPQQFDGTVLRSDMERAARQTHEVNASVAAEIPAAQTYLVATYNWRHGMPVVRDGQVRSDFGRFDLRVRQPLPFHALRTEWSAMLQLRNVLGPDYEGLYNVSLAELVGLTRGIAGGLAVRF